MIRARAADARALAVRLRTSATDVAGRVIWVVPPGRYTIRAIFKESSELRAANSRTLTVSGF